MCSVVKIDRFNGAGERGAFRYSFRLDLSKINSVWHVCVNEEDTPNNLFRIISNSGTVSPINGPATYQGHGSLSILDLYFSGIP